MGRAIQIMLFIEPGDSVNAFLHIKDMNNADFLNSHYVVFATKKGVIKKTCLAAYSHQRVRGVAAINILEGDEVVSVNLTNGSNEILMASRRGRAVRFHEVAVRPMGRTSTGVRGMLIDDSGDDEVIGMVVVNDIERETIMVVSEKGYGKRSKVEEYRATNRGGKGVRTLSVTDKTGRLVAIKTVTDDNDLMIINKSGTLIRLKVASFRLLGRATQGVRMINLTKKNDTISSVCSVAADNDSDNENVEQQDAPIADAPISDAMVNDAPISDALDADNDAPISDAPDADTDAPITE